MIFSIKSRSKKDLQTLFIKNDRLEQEKAELLALRRKVLDAERRSQDNCFERGLFTKRQVIGSLKVMRQPTVGPSQL
jgi:hypothetical protein